MIHLATAQHCIKLRYGQITNNLLHVFPKSYSSQSELQPKIHLS